MEVLLRICQHGVVGLRCAAAVEVRLLRELFASHNKILQGCVATASLTLRLQTVLTELGGTYSVTDILAVMISTGSAS